MHASKKAGKTHVPALVRRVSEQQAAEMTKDLVGSVRSWCEFITANGAGPGAQLNQNVRVARDLAKSTADVSARVGLVRQAVYNQTIQKEFPQGVRNTLIGQLTRRQRFLQEMRAALEDAAKGFESLKQSRDYKGDTYPNAIDKLSQMLQSYKAPGDAVAEAVGALTSKYSIPDAVAGT